MEYYAALMKDKVMQLAAMQKELKITLSEIRQRERNRLKLDL